MNPILTPLAKAGMVIVVLLALAAGAAVYRWSVYREGFAAGQATVMAQIEQRNKEIERLNKQLVQKDQDLIAAKQEDREKISTVYRTIRESVEPEIVEKPVYRDCRVSPGVLRSLTAAAEGGMPADPQKPADGASGKTPGPSR